MKSFTHMAMAAVIAVSALTGCATVPLSDTASADLLSPEHIIHWRPATGYERSKPWTLQDGVYWGHGSIMGYEDSFSNFVLEVDFLFNTDFRAVFNRHTSIRISIPDTTERRA